MINNQNDDHVFDFQEIQESRESSLEDHHDSWSDKKVKINKNRNKISKKDFYEFFKFVENNRIKKQLK